MNVFFSFSVTAGAFPVFFGVASVIKDICKKYPHLNFHYGGVSGGALVATSLALGVSEEEINYGRDLFASYFDRWYKIPFFHFYKFADQLMDHFLFEGAEHILNHRLFVGITEVTAKGFKNHIISQFLSPQDIAQGVLSSAHLPFHGQGPVRKFRGMWVADGGITKRIIHNEHMLNIVFQIHDHDLTLKDFLLSPCPEKWNRLYEIGRLHAENQRFDIYRCLDKASHASPANLSSTYPSDIHLPPTALKA